MSSEYDIMHASSETIADWQQCLKNPYIIHFAAVPKPWQLPTVEFGVDWWIVARHSPYYSIMLQYMCDYIEQHGEFEVVDSRARNYFASMRRRDLFAHCSLPNSVPKEVSDGAL